MTRAVPGSLVVCLSVFLSAPLVAQGTDAPAPIPASTLLAKFTSRDLPIEEARKLADELRTRPIAVRIDLFDAVRRAYGEHLDRHGKAAEGLKKDFVAAAAATQRAAMKRTGESKIAQVRKQALSITAREDLTKEHIHTELDPLLAELRGIVVPTAAQVLEHDERLAKATAAHAQRTSELEQWFDLCLEAMQHVDGDPAGRAHAQKAPPLPPPPANLPPDVLFETERMAGIVQGTQDERVLQANEALRGAMDAAEFAGTLELNRIRIALGLSAVRIDEKLGNAARDHSHDMRTLGFFSHTSPVEGKQTFGQRASRAGTSASSENIAAGHRRGEGAIEAWWYSPGHHKNMLGGHGRTGLGRSEETWTQLFGG